jgi:hypothetical protein
MFAGTPTVPTLREAKPCALSKNVMVKVVVTDG